MTRPRSSTLQRMAVSEIGLHSSADGCGVFGIGVMWASFHCVGTKLSAMLKLRSSVMGAASSRRAALSSLAEMPSGPVAEGLSCWSSWLADAVAKIFGVEAGLGQMNSTSDCCLLMDHSLWKPAFNSSASWLMMVATCRVWFWRTACQ